jgi:hypothetical protein
METLKFKSREDLEIEEFQKLMQHMEAACIKDERNAYRQCAVDITRMVSAHELLSRRYRTFVHLLWHRLMSHEQCLRAWADDASLRTAMIDLLFIVGRKFEFCQDRSEYNPQQKGAKK